MARRSRGGGKRARPAGTVMVNEVRERSDDADAFIRHPDSRKPATTSDVLAMTLGQEFVTSATTGEDAADEDLEQEVPEDVGGPFLESDASREFDPHADASNPVDATKEALPTAMGSGPPTQVDLEEAEEAQESEEGEDSAPEPARPEKK